MKVNLETDEKVQLIIDDNCNFKVWGERNGEGTMVIKYEGYDDNCVTSEMEERK